MFSPSPEMPQLADYGAIEAAVMETPRGRWFLAEHARRERSAETAAILDALARLERQIHTLSGEDRTLPYRKALTEIAAAIAVTHSEVCSQGSRQGCPGRLLVASGELDAVVKAAEAATASILAAAEKVQEHAWILRERGGLPLDCDALEASATDIYLACTAQDLSAQRIRQVTETLRFVETRIASLLDCLGIESVPSAGRDDPGDAPVFKGPLALWPDTPEAQAAVDIALATCHAPAVAEAAPPRCTGLAALDRLTPAERLRLFI